MAMYNDAPRIQGTIWVRRNDLDPFMITIIEFNRGTMSVRDFQNRMHKFCVEGEPNCLMRGTLHPADLVVVAPGDYTVGAVSFEVQVV